MCLQKMISIIIKHFYLNFFLFPQTSVAYKEGHVWKSDSRFCHVVLQFFLPLKNYTHCLETCLKVLSWVQKHCTIIFVSPLQTPVTYKKDMYEYLPQGSNYNFYWYSKTIHTDQKPASKSYQVAQTLAIISCFPNTKTCSTQRRHLVYLVWTPALRL